MSAIYFLVYSFLVSFVLLPLTVLEAYERPPSVSIELWEQLSPYFLPEDHPAKARLDKIFHKKSVTRSSNAVLKAGFFNANPGKYSHVVVSGHFDLKGYVLKMYLDSYEVNEGLKFRERVLGAIAVKQCVDEYHLQESIKVPNKWIYPIPNFSDSGLYPKNFVLIAEDVQPYNTQKTLKFWKQKITKTQLNAVYRVLKVVGLPDCAYAFNIPICRDGKLAFLDTEYCGLWPVHWRRTLQYLNEENGAYWRALWSH